MLRGIAALMVFVFHLGTTLDRYSPDKLRPLVQFGTAGVDLFFVISGFVMAYSVRNLAGQSDAQVFVARRLWRIVPLVYVLALTHIAFGALRDQWFNSAQLVNSFTILPVMKSPTFQHALQPEWTLAFELAFYLVVAAAVASSARWRLTAIAVGAALVGVTAAPLMIEFSFGVAAYALWSRGALEGRLPPWLAAAGFAFILLPNAGPRWFIYGIPSALILAATLGLNRNFKPALWLGNISYSLYLTHVVAFDALAPIAAPFLPPIGLGIVLAVGGIAISWLVYEAIEAPLMQLAEKRRKVGNSRQDFSVGIPTKDAAEPASIRALKSTTAAHGPATSLTVRRRISRG